MMVYKSSADSLKRSGESCISGQCDYVACQKSRPVAPTNNYFIWMRVAPNNVQKYSLWENAYANEGSKEFA